MNTNDLAQQILRHKYYSRNDIVAVGNRNVKVQLTVTLWCRLDGVVSLVLDPQL
jgi:hypothetical protein